MSRYPCLLRLTARQLVKDGDDETSVAEFFPHRRHFLVFRMSKHARLEVKPQPEVTEALERLIGKFSIVWCCDDRVSQRVSEQ